MSSSSQKLSFVEKTGYGAADAAANFVFMTMILFQANFYTDVLGISAGAAASILLIARLWDAVADPLVGVLADRTQTRWGKFRPWILATAVPWCVVMVLAYTAPQGWSSAGLIAYAALTNIVLMTIYSMNNIPYAALGGVMTGDVDERTKLNSFRFIAVNAAQFVVGGFTLPLVDKFSAGHGRSHGWQMTMTLWAAVCLILFLVTFATTRERIQPSISQQRDLRKDFAALLHNGPWAVLFIVTVFHFCILAFRGGALFNYYHHYVNKAAMYDFLQTLGLTAPVATPGAPVGGGLLEAFGYIVHGARSDLASSNVADVFNSIVNMIMQGVTLLVLPVSASLSRRFGKKAVAVGGFGLTTLSTLGYYLLGPANTSGIIIVTIVTAICYAPTIPVIWAMYADVADYSEWETGRRLTGIVFATLGFGLKCGLALGSSSFLWVMALFFGYDSTSADTPAAVHGFRVCSGLVVAVLFAICTVLLGTYKLNKRMTLQMARELPDRRKELALA